MYSFCPDALYILSHCLLDKMGTETSLNTEAGRDLSEVRPHPVTTALLPTKEDEEEGRQTGREVAE